MNVFFMSRVPGPMAAIHATPGNGACWSLFINRASEIFGIQLERKENPRKYSVQIQKFQNQMVGIQMVDYKILENIPFEFKSFKTKSPKFKWLTIKSQKIFRSKSIPQNWGVHIL
jgi:hypothetical protein